MANLINFDNGIFDMETKEFMKWFNKDEKIGYDYIDFIGTEKIFKQLNQYLESVFPISEARSFILTYIATCLNMRMRDDFVTCWVGSGNNGKSCFLNLVKEAFGNYYISVDRKFLEEVNAEIERIDNKCVRATPKLAQLVTARLINVSYTTIEERNYLITALQTINKRKKLTARRLYKEEFTITPNLKIITEDNVIPTSTDMNLRVFTFTNEFVDNPIKSNQRDKDEKICEKLKEMREAFIWLLLNVYG